MEHGHSCVYYGARWFYHDNCPFDGPSACELFVENLDPNTPRRVIPLRGSWVLDRPAERTAEHLRRTMRPERPQ